MSHFIGLVFGYDIDDQLSPYDEGLEVAPYKKYMSEKDIKMMAEHYKIDHRRLKSLALKMEDWTNCKGGTDKNGLYYWSRYNPNSKWDWYASDDGGRWPGYLILKNKKKATSANKDEINWKATLKQHYPFCYVSDGHWYEKGEMGWWGMSFNEMNEKKWKIQFDKFLSKIPDDEEVTVVDFHI